MFDLIVSLLEAAISEKRIEFIATQFGEKLLDVVKADSSAHEALDIKGKIDDPATIVNYIATHCDPSGKPIKVAAVAAYAGDIARNFPAKEAQPERTIDGGAGGSYTQWLVRMYIAKQFKLEDAPRIHDDILLFSLHKSKIDNKDLNSYKNLTSLYDTVEQFAEKAEAGFSADQHKAIKAVKNDIKTIVDEPNFKVISLESEEAAKAYGQGTKWCTAWDEGCMYNSYRGRGNLYVIMAMIDGTQRRFQMQYESNSFMDERDQRIQKHDISALSKFPAYKTFLNMLIGKHKSKKDD